MLHKRFVLPLALFTAALMLVVSGCAWLRRSPEQSPLPRQEAPKKRGRSEPAPQVEIHQAISQGKNKEPQLLYRADKGTVETVKIEDYIQGVGGGNGPKLAAGGSGCAGH